MKKSLILLSICSAVLLTSCGTSSYYASSGFEDGIYYRASEDARDEARADSEKVGRLIEQTKKEAARFSDTIIIASPNSQLELQYTPRTQYTIMFDDQLDSLGQVNLNFNFDDWYPGYGYGDYYSYWDWRYWHAYSPFWHRSWWGPWYGWGGWYDPWYWGFGFGWDPWYGPWGGWYAGWYGPGWWGPGYYRRRKTCRCSTVHVGDKRQDRFSLRRSQGTGLRWQDILSQDIPDSRLQCQFRRKVRQQRLPQHLQVRRRKDIDRRKDCSLQLRQHVPQDLRCSYIRIQKTGRLHLRRIPQPLRRTLLRQHQLQHRRQET